jgi:hypothetical protein
MVENRLFRTSVVQERMDGAGATASLVCAVHCALMPLVITLLPLVGLGFLSSEPVEWSLLGLSALLGVSSLCLGYRRHRSRKALCVLAVGLGLIAAGRTIEMREVRGPSVLLVVCGGVTIAGAHLVNRRLCWTCQKCHGRPATPV